MHYTKPEGRFPDHNNAPKPRWRDALLRLAAPAARLHRYRELQSAAVEELLTDKDCRGNP